MMKRLAALLLLLTLFSFNSAAQNDAALCVRAFEDRNGNGQRDPGEPLLTRGLGANLLDARGVIIQTALLDNSPTSAQGVICFENLANQQYTLEVTSAEFAATTLDNITVNITNDAATRRAILEYGGARVFSTTQAAAPAEDTTEVDREAALERVAVSAVGALAAMFGTVFIGLILYVLFLRGRRRGPMEPPPGYYRSDPRATSTSAMRAVPPPTDTGEFRQK
ncbi:MAG: hypothetical protein OHK0046_11330 [Anaerolineae bacterium]